jgi:flagellar assembly protein FliH
MAKAVFRPEELVALPDKIVINSPTSYPDLAHLAPVEEVVEDMDDVEEYTGPTADDLRREAEMFKSQWEEEKERMFSSARAEADNIVKEAEKNASQEVQRKTDEGEVLKQQAEEEAARILAEGKTRTEEAEKEVRKNLEAERKEALEKGREEGREKGYAEGKAEVDRLIERTQVVLERSQDKRAEILAETEQEIIDLVLLISRKIIKVISENQRNVIISNVIQALRKVKSRGNVTIRVNMIDLQLATEHKQEFIKQLEGVKSIQVVEDSTVDSGGCIIETDFGEIDARISSQLAELESKILEISPIKSKIRTDNQQNMAENAQANQAASSSLLDLASSPSSSDGAEEMSPAANAALTASAALAALASMSVKGRRETDKKMIIT